MLKPQTSGHTRPATMPGLCRAAWSKGRRGSFPPATSSRPYGGRTPYASLTSRSRSSSRSNNQVQAHAAGQDDQGDEGILIGVARVGQTPMLLDPFDRSLDNANLAVVAGRCVQEPFLASCSPRNTGAASHTAERAATEHGQ